MIDINSDGKIFVEIENFSEKELACKHCGKSVIHHSSIVLLQATRYMLNQMFNKNVRLIVNSGYRCPAHNKTVGGVENSQHTSTIDRIHSRAFDIWSPDISTQALFETLKRSNLWTTVLFYEKKNFCHIDNRKRDSIYTEII